MQFLRFFHPASRVLLLAALFLPAMLSAQIKVITNGDVGIGIDPPTVKLDVNGAIRLRAALHDISNNTGNAGQILSSTGTGTDWIDATSLWNFTPTGVLYAGPDNQAKVDVDIFRFQENNGDWGRLVINCPTAKSAGLFGDLFDDAPLHVNWDYEHYNQGQPFWNSGFATRFGTYVNYNFDEGGYTAFANMYRSQSNNTGVGQTQTVGAYPIRSSRVYLNKGTGLTFDGAGFSIFDQYSVRVAAVDGSGNSSLDNNFHFQLQPNTNSAFTNYAQDNTRALTAHHTSGDITLWKYPNSRDDAATATNFLYTDNNGRIQSGPLSEVPGTVYTAGTGIGIAGNIISNTSLNTDNQNLSLSGQSLGISGGTGVTLPVVGITAGSGISVSSAAGNVTITNTGGSLPTGASTETLRFNSSSVLVNSNILRNDGTTIGINGAPNNNYKLYINGNMRADGSGVFRGTGLIANDFNAAGIRLWNTASGDIYSLSSEDDGTGKYASDNNGLIFSVPPGGDLKVNYHLGIGSVSSITPNTIIGRDASGMVGTVGIGSGLSLSSGTLSATGGSYVAGTGINIAGNVISNTSLNTDAQNLSLAGQALSISGGTGATLPVVGITAGTGISVSSTAGNVTITNSAASLPAGTSTQTLRYNASNSLVANSVITNDGTNVGIGGAPVAGVKASVTGQMTVSSNATVGGIALDKAKFNVDGTQANSTAGVNVGARLNLGGPLSSGDKGLYIEGSSANTVYGIDDNINTANTLIERIKNMGTSATSNSMQQIAVNNATAGDPTTQFTVENGNTFVSAYSMGIDNSDADKFKIQPATGLSSTTETGITLQTVNINGTNYSRMGINEVSPLSTLDASSNIDAITLPRGNTAQRPVTNISHVRYNTDFNGYEVRSNIVSELGGWHRLSCTSATTIVTNAGSGGGASVTIAGDDLKGIITLNTGTLPTANVSIFTATFGQVFSVNPYILITPANALAATDATKYYVTLTGTPLNTWQLTANGTLTASTQYKFYYQVQN